MCNQKLSCLFPDSFSYVLIQHDNVANLSFGNQFVMSRALVCIKLEVLFSFLGKELWLLPLTGGENKNCSGASYVSKGLLQHTSFGGLNSLCHILNARFSNSILNLVPVALRRLSSRCKFWGWLEAPFLLIHKQQCSCEHERSWCQQLPGQNRDWNWDSQNKNKEAHQMLKNRASL